MNFAINTSIIMDISNTPYALSNDTAYQTWRDHKLINFTNDINKLVISIDQTTAPTTNEINALQGLVNQYNMGLYRLNNPAKEAAKNKRSIPAFARFFGLQTL